MGKPKTNAFLLNRYDYLNELGNGSLNEIKSNGFSNEMYMIFLIYYFKSFRATSMRI